MVIRFDNTGGRIGSNLRAHLARTGAQRYDTGIEQRDLAEVFASESIATLLNCRVQVSHTPGSPTVGKVVMPFRRVDIDGHSYIEAELEITDAITRQRIDRGDLSEISMGYSCVMAGNRQTQIRYDHCALLERHDRARCGEHCRVLDSFSSVPQQQKAPVMSCACSPNRSDAVARRDAFRSSEPSRRNWSDEQIDIYFSVQDRMDQQATEAARPLPQYRVDAVTEARIDAAADVARVSRQDVHNYLRMNVPMHRGIMPTEDQIEHAVHTIRLRGFYTGGGR